MEKTFDVTVIGGGPGGYLTAIRCAQYGLKTALVEADQLGGTCLNRGCIPTKTLLHSAEVYHSAFSSKNFGVEMDNIRFNYAAIAARKDKVVKQLRGGIEFLEKSHGVEIIKGYGILADAHTITVDDKRIITDSIILATGSTPELPPIKGIDGKNILTSDGVLSLTTCPDKIIIIGGGIIGIEFATLYAAFGKKVTVVEMLPGLLPMLDDDVSAQFIRSLKSRGVDIHTSAAVSSLSGGDTVTCSYVESGKTETIVGDICIVCTGRKPLTRNIGLEEAGVKTDEHGYVQVNDCMQTSIPSIYAIGDITGKNQLAHVAAAQGMAAAANIAGRTVVMKYDAVPACIYSSPEIAYVGLSTTQAKAKGYNVSSGSFSVHGNGKALSMGENVGIIKLITERHSGQILGAQIFSPHATDMIGEICVALKNRMRAVDLGNVIHPHPTISECIMEAAHAVEGLCCNAPAEKQQGG